MRKLVLSAAAASAFLLAGANAPVNAAVGITAAPSMQIAVDNANAVEEVRYVCRHRYYSSRRVCWWQPRPRIYRPYRHYHRPYRYYHRRHWR